MRLPDLFRTDANGVAKIQVIAAPLGNVAVIEFSEWTGGPSRGMNAAGDRVDRLVGNMVWDTSPWRITVADRTLENHVLRYTLEPTRVRHFIYARKVKHRT